MCAAATLTVPKTVKLGQRDVLVPENRVDGNQESQWDNPEPPRRQPSLGQKANDHYQEHPEEMLEGGAEIEDRNVSQRRQRI